MLTEIRSYYPEISSVRRNDETVIKEAKPVDIDPKDANFIQQLLGEILTSETGIARISFLPVPPRLSDEQLQRAANNLTQLYQKIGVEVNVSIIPDNSWDIEPTILVSLKK